MSIEWNNIWNDYPINRDKIWLNNCGASPPSNFILERMRDFYGVYSQNLFLSQEYGYSQILEKIKNSLSNLIGCKDDEITLLHNTAEGMNNVAYAVDFQEGDKILLLEDEYPSNVYPWAALYKRKGVTIQFIPTEKTPEKFYKRLEQIFEKEAPEKSNGKLKGKSNRIRMISISGVHWLNGMPMPLEKIGALCEKFDVLFCVDGSQAVGMLPIDVHRMKIDFMAFSAWKWLMGPLGLGGFYVNEKHIPKMEPAFRGTNNVVDDMNYLPYRKNLKPNADRFIFSSSSLSDWVYFQSSLQYLDKIGWDKIRQRIYDLAGLLSKNLTELGYYLPVENYDEPTGIISARPELASAQSIVEKLESQNIITSPRGQYVRFSPHIYNNEHQIDTVVKALTN